MAEEREEEALFERGKQSEYGGKENGREESGSNSDVISEVHEKAMLAAGFGRLQCLLIIALSFSAYLLHSDVFHSSLKLLGHLPLCLTKSRQMAYSK